MSIRDCVARVLTEYLDASKASFTQHPLANFIRRDFPQAIEQACALEEHFVLKGSAGQGNWARGPWVGLFDPIVTTSAQRGYYPVYLFREDMRGVYLSLNQAMTEAKEHYKADAKTALRARAANYRAMLGSQTTHFPLTAIDLAPAAASNDTAFYEAGNICAKYYPTEGLPSEAELVTDLVAMLRLYDALMKGETGSGASNSLEGDEPPDLDYEDATRFRLHKRIERNASLAKKVKQRKGCTCEVCESNFEVRYGSIGKDYIEAHHLRPLASLKGTKVSMDPDKDFAVLCANCHRMIHRSGCVDDIERFRKEHYRGDAKGQGNTEKPGAIGHPAPSVIAPAEAPVD